MNTTRKWVKAGVILLAAGILICGISFAILGFDFGKLSTVRYETNTYDVQEDFQNISIDADTEKITLVPSGNDICSVVCLEEEDDPHQVSVRDNTLTVERKEKNRWHLFHIGSITESPEITVYLPEDAYRELSIEADTGDVSIPEDFTFDSISVSLDTGDVSCLASASGSITVKTSTGHITIADVSAAEMRLTASTGKTEVSNVELTGDLDIRESTGKAVLENVSCANFSSDGSTGSLLMTNVAASNAFHLERDTGNIKFDGCDAETIHVRTSTGKVTGTLLTDKVFVTKTDTGSVRVPETAAGGRCEITTDTGNIRIEVKS